MISALRRASNALLRIARARVILVSLAILLVALGAAQLSPVGARAMNRLGQGRGTLDMEYGYSEGRVAQLFSALGEEGRLSYRGFLALDALFALTYAWAQSLMISRLFRKASLPPALGIVNLAPWIRTLFDLAENALILGMLGIYPSSSPAMSALAGFATGCKWATYYAVLAVLLGLGFLTARKPGGTGLRREPKEA